MKILNVMQGTNLGGMEQASLRLMAALQARGHTCEVISLNPVGALGALLEKEGIRVTGLPYLGKGGWRSFPRLLRALSAAKADSVLMTGHNLLAMLALRDLCKGRRVLAIHFHHQGVKPRWQWKLIYRVACAQFQAITFPSDFVRAEAEALYPHVTPLAHTVRNPLPVPRLPTAADRTLARSVLGIPEGVPVVGNAGWLIARKRFDVFLRVASEVASEMPDAVFLIAGDGEERARLTSLARDLGLSHRVRWLGWQQDLTRFFHCLDVMLFNSDWDAMGLAPLEAMSYGIPVVASVRHGGLGEVMSKEADGGLMAEHDVGALAARVRDLLARPDVARARGLAGRDRVAEMSDGQRLASQVECLLQGRVCD